MGTLLPEDSVPGLMPMLSLPLQPGETVTFLVHFNPLRSHSLLDGLPETSLQRRSFAAALSIASASPSGVVEERRLPLSSEVGTVQLQVPRDAQALQFNTVMRRPVSVQLPLQNRGSIPVPVVITTNTPAFTVDPANIILQPGVPRVVHVEYQAWMAGTVTDTLTLTLPTSCYKLPLHGSTVDAGSTPILCDKPVLNFGGVRPFTPGVEALTVTNSAAEPITVSMTVMPVARDDGTGKSGAAGVAAAAAASAGAGASGSVNGGGGVLGFTLLSPSTFELAPGEQRCTHVQYVCDGIVEDRWVMAIQAGSEQFQVRLEP
jgi:hypothetical protein